MNKTDYLSRYKILIVALGVSLLWHTFWLSAVKVVSSPEAKERVRFSKVSFFGPFHNRGPINLRVQPKERGFLEKRYFKVIERGAVDARSQNGKTRYRYESTSSAGIAYSQTMTSLIDESLGGSRPEPDYDAE
jgi:hypothetical protein